MPGDLLFEWYSYQCAYETFEASGYLHADAERLMRKSVQLAVQARDKFIKESDGTVHLEDVRIALSLGPFGATCSPGQEYGGFYPPPYGPRAWSASGPNTNAFEDDDFMARDMAIDALIDFHLQRLRIFSNDLESWQRIDIVAFETIPLAREIKAIRSAMRLLQIELQPRPEGFDWKPWWISTVWPDGKFPHESSPGQRSVSAQEVVQSLLHGKSKIAGQSIDHQSMFPDAIGINCTSMTHFQEVLTEMEDAVHEVWEREAGPWLVLYPNGGEAYDPSTKSWSKRDDGNRDISSWGKALAGVAQSAISRRTVWAGVIVGGCCKTGPQDIENLIKCIGQ